MTINAEWVSILKSSCPGAFKPTLPVVPVAWFVDGQIKLMKGAWITTWEVFFKMPDNSNTLGAMKKFFLKIHNSDVICVHEPEHSIETPKLKFLHSLIGCHFVIKAGRETLRKSNLLDSR